MAKRNYFKSEPDLNEDLASRLIHALNHPLRRRILELLMQEPASATTLADLLDTKLGNVSYHLTKVLGEECEVVTIIEKHQRRGAWEKVYDISPEAYVSVIHWARIPEPIRSGL